MPRGVAYSGLFKSSPSAKALLAKLFPAMATRRSSMPRLEATRSRRPSSLLPPPARNRAEGAPPLSSDTWAAMASARRPMGSWITAWTSSKEAVFSRPRMSVYRAASPGRRFRLISSAVWKSTR